MFNDQIEDSGQVDSTTPPVYPDEPYEVADEEMSQLNRGGPATDDQMVEITDPAGLNPDDQEVRNIEKTATENVADVDSKEWEDTVAAEERGEELSALEEIDAVDPDNT